MLGLAGHVAGNWLFFAVGISPAAMLASVTFTWAAVRTSLSCATQWLSFRRAIINRGLLVVLAVTVAAGLAGCAGQSDFRFFKAYGPGQVEQRYIGLNVFAVSQTDRTPSEPK
jgi:hypothetical protein